MWTEERTDRMKAMWLGGCSAGVIARELGEGVSRSAVCGKAHRLGLMGRGKTTKTVPRKAMRNRIQSLRVVDGLPPEPPKPAAPALMLPLPKLTTTTCRFPMEGRGADTLFCGHVCTDGGSYCAHHHRIVYRAPEKRERKQAQSIAIARAFERWAA